MSLSGPGRFHRLLLATAETFASFVTSSAADFCAATLKRNMAGIRKVHRLLNLEDAL